MSGVISGGKDPAVPFLLRNKEAGGAKVNTGLIKIIINLNKVKEEIKTFQKIIRIFTRSLSTPSRIGVGFS